MACSKKKLVKITPSLLLKWLGRLLPCAVCFICVFIHIMFAQGLCQEPVLLCQQADWAPDSLKAPLSSFYSEEDRWLGLCRSSVSGVVIVPPQTEEADREVTLIPPAVSYDVIWSKENLAGDILDYHMYLFLIRYITIKSTVEIHLLQPIFFNLFYLIELMRTFPIV